MPSPVEVLRDDARDIHTAIKSLIARFYELNLETRLAESAWIFDQLRVFFERHGLILGDRQWKDPQYETLEAHHQDTLDIYERMIMLHVEEPDYYDRLVQLDDAFKIYSEDPYAEYLQQVHDHLSEEDRNTLTRQFQAIHSTAAQVV